jgi:hypothetical protein
MFVAIVRECNAPYKLQHTTTPHYTLHSVSKLPHVAHIKAQHQNWALITAKKVHQ